MLLVEGSLDTDHAQREEGVKIPGDSHPQAQERSLEQILPPQPSRTTIAGTWIWDFRLELGCTGGCCLLPLEAAIKGLMS